MSVPCIFAGSSDCCVKLNRGEKKRKKWKRMPLFSALRPSITASFCNSATARPFTCTATYAAVAASRRLANMASSQSIRPEHVKTVGELGLLTKSGQRNKLSNHGLPLAWTLIVYLVYCNYSSFMCSNLQNSTEPREALLSSTRSSMPSCWWGKRRGGTWCRLNGLIDYHQIGKSYSSYS